MRRLLVLLALVVPLLAAPAAALPPPTTTPTASPQIGEGTIGDDADPTQPDAPTPAYCSSYTGMISHPYAGRIYSTTNNTCLAFEGQYVYPVTRYKCYVDGLLYDPNTNARGCRWVGQIILQYSESCSSGWTTFSSRDILAPPSAPFNEDSFRWYGGGRYYFLSGLCYRAVVRARADGIHRVRFAHTNYTETLQNMPNNYSAVWHAA